MREYAGQGSEAAFSEVVHRYIDFVYSAGLRMVKSRPLAEDVSQKVFLALARNAGHLADRPVLAGWLHCTTRNIAANAVRLEVRRRAWEVEAAAMNELLNADSESAWETIAPHLDEALAELSEADREAILLRYFQHKSAHEMADRLGISSEAAQKRVHRAIERLRDLFAKRGIAAAAGALGVVISTHAVQAAPASLALTISAAAVAGASLTTSAATLGSAKIIIMSTLQKTILTCVALAAVTAGVYESHKYAEARQRLRAARQTQHQTSQQASAPVLHASNTVAALAASHALQPQGGATARKSTAAATPRSSGQQSASTGGFTSTEMYKLLTTKKARLTAAQAAPYLAANGRNASSLLAAFRTTGDMALLNEALQNHSDNPQVGFEAATRNEATPQQRRAALDTFKQAAPDNAIGYYLSALDHFKANQVDEAVDDLNAAATKTVCQDYTLDRIRTDEDMYRQAGYAPGESQFIANAFLPEAHLVQMVELGRNLVDLAAGYASIGDQESQKAALQMALDLGRHFDDPAAGQTMRWQLIGIRIERAALEAMDPAALVLGTSQSVGDRLTQLASQKDMLQGLTKQADPLWKSMTDSDWTDYHTQMAASGEEAAVRWVVNTFPRHN